MKQHLQTTTRNGNTLEQKDKSADIAYFMSFCIEYYRNRHKIPSDKAAEILSRTGTLEYLMNNYDVLHTQSPQWILSDMEDFVNQHNL